MNQQSSFFKTEKLLENFYKFRQNHFTTSLIIILAIVSIILYNLDRIIGISIAITIEVLLAIDAIIIAVVIASTQENQINKLKFIGAQTKETAEKLRTETLIQDNVKKFFIIPNYEENKYKKYRCFFPVEYKSKPLPSISQGDFYALHVLGTYIEENNLELQGVTIKEGERIGNDLLDGNVIFICAPLANIALRKIFESEDINSDPDYEELKSKNWPLDKLKLPCWFLEDHRGRLAECPIRKIMVFDKLVFDKSIEIELLASPAQGCYDTASKLPLGERFECRETNQRDFGIFARLNKNGNQYIIIAGLHQYGTWIVASLLNRLLSGDNVDYKEVFLDKKDFIAVISGEFNNKKLIVNSKSIEVYGKYIWTREGEDKNWERIY